MAKQHEIEEYRRATGCTVFEANDHFKYKDLKKKITEVKKIIDFQTSGSDTDLVKVLKNLTHVCDELIDYAYLGDKPRR